MVHSVLSTRSHPYTKTLPGPKTQSHLHFYLLRFAPFGMFCRQECPQISVDGFKWRLDKHVLTHGMPSPTWNVSDAYFVIYLLLPPSRQLISTSFLIITVPPFIRTFRPLHTVWTINLFIYLLTQPTSLSTGIFLFTVFHTATNRPPTWQCNSCWIPRPYCLETNALDRTTWYTNDYQTD